VLAKPPGVGYMRPMHVLRTTFLLLLLGAAQEVQALAAQQANVPQDLKQVVIDHFSPMFVVPQTAIWEFDTMSHYLLGGTLICGKVNYQDSLHHYVGPQPFYLVIKSDHSTGDGDLLPLYVVRDPTGTKRSTYTKVCHLPG